MGIVWIQIEAYTCEKGLATGSFFIFVFLGPTLAQLLRLNSGVTIIPCYHQVSREINEVNYVKLVSFNFD